MNNQESSGAALELEQAIRSSIEPDRVGIERAFDVIRNHAVHTKGYVLTAFKLIEEFGTPEDKAKLGNLLHEKSKQGDGLAPKAVDGTGTMPTPSKKRKAAAKTTATANGK